MKKRSIKSFSAWAVVVACLSMSPVLLAVEEFQARLLTAGGPTAGRATSIKMIVESYTSLEEVGQLARTLYESGYEPFMSALRGMNKGYIRPIGGRGIKITIHGAQIIQTDKGRKIVLVTERQSWDVDARQSMDSRYAFMVIELNLNNKGKGEGKFYEQADIRLTPQGTIEMASSNSIPKQLFGVRTLQ